MPIYLYETENGELIQEIRSVGDRDKGPMRRRMAAPYVFRGHPDPSTTEQGAKRFYKQAEEKNKLRSRRYSKSKIKQIWGW
jgi:hypothetical protein